MCMRGDGNSGVIMAEGCEDKAVNGWEDREKTPENCTHVGGEMKSCLVCGDVHMLGIACSSRTYKDGAGSLCIQQASLLKEPRNWRASLHLNFLGRAALFEAQHLQE